MSEDTKTTIDYLRFRSQSNPGEVVAAMAPLFGERAPLVHLGGYGRGLLGFESSAQILVGNAVAGRLDYGGASQRGWVRADMGGQGCGWVTDWDAGVASIEALEAAQLRRVDIALTTWNGEVKHEDVVSAYHAGRFATFGRPPVLTTIDKSDEWSGRTCYIGSRESPKFLRSYEKGLEMLAKMRLPGRVDTCLIDGHPVQGIYRVELELKAKGIVLGWDTIERRDEFFAGSYPFCRDLLPDIDPDVLQRRPEKAPQRELAAALLNVRIQWGNALYTALKAYGGDICAVWEKICGHEDSKRLVEAGVLMVEPEDWE